MDMNSVPNSFVQTVKCKPPQAAAMQAKDRPDGQSTPSPVSTNPAGLATVARTQPDDTPEGFVLDSPEQTLGRAVITRPCLALLPPQSVLTCPLGHARVSSPNL